MNLTEFSVWYKSRSFPKNTNPWSGKIFYTDSSSSTIIFSHENFLVEEYHLFPNTKVPLHNHPFETLSIFLGGSFVGFRDAGETRIYNEKYIAAIGNILPPGVNHGFDVGPEGAALLVISKWDNLDQRTSATIEYNGPSMGPIHTKLLEKYNNARNNM